MTSSLFPHLAERITAENTRAIREGGEYVVYWMRTAVRAHENPALDVALTIGAQRGLPVFVYHALSERYPHASDRQHRFILEGARDVAAECAARGIGYAFHLERPGHRVAVLDELSRDAALIVTETMPIPPLRDWTRRVAERAACAVWSVDTACVVPMRLVGTAHTRAFAYRQATAALQRERLTRAWSDVMPAASAPLLPPLPFAPVSLATADLAALVAECEIDHGVAPVPHTVGGSLAGYARWERFVREGHLARYADRRNDPLADGVSRMSAYLHFGMVSPFRLAREAAAARNDGGAKYLDELLIWRELAYAFCYWHDAPTTLDAVPTWAQETLRAHERDRRDVLSWESLSRARTGDALWDATQRSLLIHGELHNNLRMTWGKAIPGWTANAGDALAMLRALNHRYALDGRDPASYGGLLWCLGQFDRPFTPEVPVLGTLRPRSTVEHARRVNVAAYTARASTPALEHAPRVLVIGAGISGLACARALHDHGLSVHVLDKGRGVGGRTSTRREGSWRFNHGAPSFASRDARLAPYLTSWLQDGVVAHAASPRTYVGAPGMSALAQHLAVDLTVTTSARATRLERVNDAWRVHAVVGVDAGAHAFDADVVLVAVPAPQAVELLRQADTTVLAAPLHEPLATVSMAPCWSTMYVASASGTAQVRLADAEWSTAHLDDDASAVSESMLRDAALAPANVAFARAHRWRYAHVVRGLRDDALWLPSAGLGACGDWGAFRDSDDTADRYGVERAWLSGIALAGRVLGGATK